jgi:hypothetical protein
MDANDREMLIRVDENVKSLIGKVDPLIATVQKHGDQLLVIKNDDHWRKRIFSGFVGLLGVILGALAEFFRK